MAGFTPEDFDYAVRTVWGEARGEPTLGQQSVAAVIKNRAKAANTGFKNVVLAPNQFEPWSTKRDQLMKLSPQSPEYQRIADSIRPIFESEADPTNGATHFYSPSVQAALGRRMPSWDNGTGTKIGTHLFLKLGGPVPAAPNSTAQPSPASAPITTGSIPGSPPMADFSTSGLSPEEVALRRRYGQQAYQAGTDASPVGHWTQALARVVQGANAGMWNSQAQEGETAGRKAMVDAIMSGNPKAVLGTQYGAAMAPQFLEQSIRQSDPMYQAQLRAAQDTNAHNAAMRPVQEQTAQIGLQHARTMQPIQEDTARANLKKLTDKDAVNEFIKGILAPDTGQPAIQQPAPQARPMSDNQSGIVTTDPNLIKVQSAPAQQPPAAPAQSPKNLRDIIKSRPLAEQQAFAMMYGTDPKKAMEMLQGWTATQPDKATMHDIGKEELAVTNALSGLSEIQRQYKPEYLQAGPQLQNAWSSWKAKFTGGKGLSADEQSKLRDYAAFRSASWENLNKYLKDMSGTAVTENEMQRILRARPNPGTGLMDGDDPVTFKAKMDEVIKSSRLAVARYRYLRENGFKGDVNAMSQQLALEKMPQIIDQEGMKILQRMKAESPGKSDAELLPRAQEETAKRFGLAI